MNKEILFSLWDSVWFNVLSTHHQKSSGILPGVRFCNWVKSSTMSLPGGCMPPLPTCLPPAWGNLGLLEALTWRDPSSGKFPWHSLTTQLPAISSHHLLTLVPGTDLGTQEPRISLSIAPCLSLQPQSRSHTSVSNCKTKGPQIFLFNRIHYFREELAFLIKTTWAIFSFPCTSSVVRVWCILSRCYFCMSILTLIPTTRPSSKCFYQEVILELAS